MPARFISAIGLAVISVFLFASVIYDMSLSVANSKTIVFTSLLLGAAAVYQLARGIAESNQRGAGKGSQGDK